MSKFADILYQTVQRRRAANSRVYNLTRADIALVEGTAFMYGFPPEWLANLIDFETARTWSPSITNPTSGATGLIQFMPATARDLGTSTSALRSMSFRAQWRYVDAYLQRRMTSAASKGLYDRSSGQVTRRFTQTDLFMMIFYPVAVGNPNYRFPANVVRANNGIDTPKEYVKRALQGAIFKGSYTRAAAGFGIGSAFLLALGGFIIYQQFQ